MVRGNIPRVSLSLSLLLFAVHFRGNFQRNLSSFLRAENKRDKLLAP